MFEHANHLAVSCAQDAASLELKGASCCGNFTDQEELSQM